VRQVDFGGCGPPQPATTRNWVREEALLEPWPLE
jgi:hypothetical protein